MAEQGRKRKRAKKRPASADQLDERFPGNTAARAIIALLQPALETYQAFLNQHPPQPAPGLTTSSVAAATSSSSPAAGGGNEGQQQQHDEQQQQQHDQHAVTDYVALAALRAVLKPKLRFTVPGQGQQPPTERVYNLFNTLVENPSDMPLSALAHDAEVVLPPRSALLMSDVRQLAPLVAWAAAPGHAAPPAVVLADPPWENASVARSGHYRMLPARQLCGLPMRQLLDQRCGLLALWVTNRARTLRAVQQELLPAWGLQHVATWYWLKVDPSAGGAPLIPLGCMHRHPWEQLLLCAPSAALGAQQWHSGTQSGAVGGAAAAPAGADLAATRPADDGVTATVLEAYAEVLGTRVVFAAPQEHSRKPLLHDMLRKCGRQLQQRLAGCAGAAPNASAASSRCMKNDDAAMPMQRDVRCLELFARQLQPGWTCWGDEVLHFPTAAAAAAHATAAEGVVSAAVPAGCTKHAAAGAAGQLPDDGAAAGLPQQENGVVTFCADKGYHVMRLHGSHIDEGRVLSTASCSQIQVRP